MVNYIYIYFRRIIVKKLVYALLLIIVLTGCADLKAVRNYADESARFSAYTELTTRFRDTYEREKPYLSGEAERLAVENDKKRKDIYKDLLSIHNGISTYMKTLAVLAGEDSFDISKDIDSLADAIRKNPEFGLDEKHVDAYANITKIAGKWMTSAKQQKAVREMIIEGDPHLQKLLDGMLTLVRYYRTTSDNEQKSVSGLLDVGIAFTDDPKDQLLATLARVHKQSKDNEYEMFAQKYNAAEEGIKNIADGHKELLKNVNDLSSREAKDIIDKFAKDIRAIRADLKTFAD